MLILKNLTFLCLSLFKCTLILWVVVVLSCNTSDNTGISNSGASDLKATPNDEIKNEILIGHAAKEIGLSINCIFQDQNNNYWFSTNGDGVYRYDGKSLIQFSQKDGLLNDYVGKIQEDSEGNIWFSCVYGISRFDGKQFTSFTNKDALHSNDEITSEWKLSGDDLWFIAGGGAYRYDQHSFSYSILPVCAADSRKSNTTNSKDPFSDPMHAYSIYCSMKDRNGNLWFGTQTLGVCRFDGKEFTWFTEKGLSGPAVRGLFEDSKGNLWFGNNGSGLFRYDPLTKQLSNFTREKGLSNDDFVLSGTEGPGTLARVWAMNEDDNGNLWFGTVDAGVWRYDGNQLTNYTFNDGLSTNAINTIFKDNKGELWFGTDGGGVYQFNGISFFKRDFK